MAVFQLEEGEVMGNDDALKWPAFVAISLLVVIAAIAITALIRYSVKDAQTILDWMGPLIGVVTGAFVGYFFTRGQVQTATQLAATSTEQARQSHETAQVAQEAAKEANERADTLSTAVSNIVGELEPAKYQELLANDSVRRALSPR